jgi:hypothetical protein
MLTTLRWNLSVTRTAVVAAALAGCAMGRVWAQSAPTEAGAPTGEYSSSLVANLSLPEGMGTHALAASGMASERYRSGAGPNWRQKAASNFALDFGGGFNAPHPDSTPNITWGGQFNVGAGYNFSPRFALLAEYQFIDDKLPGRMVAQTGADGGNAHIWSLTLNPIVSLFPKSQNDVYLTGGGGFYRKVTNFTDPVDTYYCDYYYCSIGTSNLVIGHFSSNQGGWSGGMGFQRHIGGAFHQSRMKVYMEARYLHILTPAITTQPNGLGTVSVNEGTTLFPITFGVRW